MKIFPPVFLALFLAAAAAQAETVTLSELPGALPLYRIDGAFEVAAPRSQVWAVLTDYAALKGVVPSMRSSCVLRREGSSALVEQVAVGRFLFFSRSVRLLLRVDESPATQIRFTDTGKAFRHYQGSWTLRDVPGGVAVDYRLEVSQADMAPPFIERGLFQDNALDLMRLLKAEIGRRAALAGAAEKKALPDAGHKDL
jgi:hypothetical protein